MQRLVLQSAHYRQVLRDFRSYLEPLGYNRNTTDMLVRCSQELLFRLEHQGITTLNQVVATHIQQHYHYLQQRPHSYQAGSLSERMIIHHLYSLRVFFQYAQHRQLIASHPMSGLRFPKVTTQRVRPILSQEEIQSLYQQCISLREQTILHLHYGCGLRSSEGSLMNVADVRLREQYLRVRKGKGGKSRAVPFTERMARDLKAYLLEERRQYVTDQTKDTHATALLLNDHGRRMLPAVARRHLRRLLYGAGLDTRIDLHCLRHSIATHLLERGMPVGYVRDFLGHKYLESTQVYARVSNEQLQSL